MPVNCNASAAVIFYDGNLHDGNRLLARHHTRHTRASLRSGFLSCFLTWNQLTRLCCAVCIRVEGSGSYRAFLLKASGGGLWGSGSSERLPAGVSPLDCGSGPFSGVYNTAAGDNRRRLLSGALTSSGVVVELMLPTSSANTIVRVDAYVVVRTTRWCGELC